jgi:hypothetical protein
MKAQEQPKAFVPFFTGKRNGQYFYRGVRWVGATNLMGFGQLAHVDNGITNTTKPEFAPRPVAPVEAA